MSNVTIAFGVILIALGLAGYVATGQESPTALIPAAFGVLLLICGVLARKEHLRKHAMHAAAALGLLGFLGTARGLVQAFALLGGGTVERPAAVTSQAVMAVLSLIFVVLCVKSFIDARRARPA